MEQLDDITGPIDPAEFEDHVLIGDSMRGRIGETVKVHKNDLAILRANKLIADPDAVAEVDPAAQAKAEKAEKAAQAKAEKEAKAAQAKAEHAAPDLPAIPNIADMPGV